MVYGRADEGDAEVYGDGFFEAVDFDGDVTLVVIHDDDDVVHAVDSLVEDGVGGVRPGGVDTVHACGFDCRGDLLGLGVADQAVVGGVGVQGGNRDSLGLMNPQRLKWSSVMRTAVRMFSVVTKAQASGRDLCVERCMQRRMPLTSMV